MQSQHDPTKITIVIALNPNSDPIEGTLTEPESHASAFRGWLALASLLETIRKDGRPQDAADTRND
jgi:hypothetical protein